MVVMAKKSITWHRCHDRLLLIHQLRDKDTSKVTESRKAGLSCEQYKPSFLKQLNDGTGNH